MKKIKIGVFGARRGADVAMNFLMLDCAIVAICDRDKTQRNAAAERLGGRSVRQYDDFDEFINEEMDAVILANYFQEHAPYAIKCLEKGIHVFSECLSNGTMAEGVCLIRTAEKSNAVYMLAENYPQMLFNWEMKRVFEGGTLGKLLYAEGEYNHPVDSRNVGFKKTYNYFPEHWRNFLPRSYYITHSLGPLMWATGAIPRRVTSFSVYSPIEGDVPTAAYVGDRAAIITTQNDDGSVFRVTGCATFGGHHNSYRICGTEGQIENLRGMGEQVMLRYNSWSKPEGAETVRLYTPCRNDRDEDLIRQSGHGGGDYLTCRMFVDCIKEGRQPECPFDVYSAVTMASVALLAHRSMLEGGKPYDIPDFRKEEERIKWEKDFLSPFYGADGSLPTLPACSHPDFKPTDRQVELFCKALECPIPQKPEKADNSPSI